MAKQQVKPLISGGKTLSAMHHGKKASGGGKSHAKKKVWYEDGGVKFGEPYRGDSYQTGNAPADVTARKGE